MLIFKTLCLRSILKHRNALSATMQVPLCSEIKAFQTTLDHIPLLPPHNPPPPFMPSSASTSVKEIVLSSHFEVFLIQ